jgi:CRISPR-associated protein Csm1
MNRASDLQRLIGEYTLSRGYLYDLLRYTDMAGEVARRPEAALWHSQFAYRTRRLVETRFREVEDRAEREAQRRRLQWELAKAIADEGIATHEAAYKIALFTYLYQQRD